MESRVSPLCADFGLLFPIGAQRFSGIRLDKQAAYDRLCLDRGAATGRERSGAMTEREAGRVVAAIERESLLADFELLTDPPPDCEYGPCGDCLRTGCPDRVD